MAGVGLGDIHPSFCVAGVALGDIHPSLCVVGVALMALGWLWRAWSSGGAVAFCVASVALRDIHLLFVWQAWHLTTSIVTLRGRRGTYGTGLALVARLVMRWRRGAAAFCVAGVALGDIHPSLCVAGVALMALGWLWWRAWSPGGAVAPRRFAWQAWHFVTSTFTLCGRRGT